MNTLQWGMVIAHIIGLGLGWYLKTKHIGLPAEYVTALQDWLANHHRNTLAGIVQGATQGSQSKTP